MAKNAIVVALTQMIGFGAPCGQACHLCHPKDHNSSSNRQTDTDRMPGVGGHVFALGWAQGKSLKYTKTRTTANSKYVVANPHSRLSNNAETENSKNNSKFDQTHRGYTSKCDSFFSAQGWTFVVCIRHPFAACVFLRSAVENHTSKQIHSLTRPDGPQQADMGASIVSTSRG